MNFRIREVVENKDIFKTCDFMAVKNNDDTYIILTNRNSSQIGKVATDIFKKELAFSDEPIVLNCSLFKDHIQ